MIVRFPIVCVATMATAATVCAIGAHVPHKHDPIGNWNNIYLYNVIQSVPVRNKARWRGTRSRRGKNLLTKSASIKSKCDDDRTHVGDEKKEEIFFHGHGSRQFHTEVPNDDCQWIASSSSNRSNRSICLSIMCGTYNKMPHTHVPNVKFTSKHSPHTRSLGDGTRHHITSAIRSCYA